MMRAFDAPRWLVYQAFSGLYREIVTAVRPG